MQETNGMTEEKGRDHGTGPWIRDHLFAKFETPKADLSGRTVLVTGGNAGLGYDAILHFARCNASRIIIASRSLPRCLAAAEKVYKDVPSYRGKIDTLELDLASFASVIAFCENVNADPGRLDIVLANAGISNTSFQRTGDGHEAVLQVNGISTALMGLLILPKLEETAGRDVPEGSNGLKPTLTIVASGVHYWAKFPQQNAPGSLIDALDDPNQFVSGIERYNMSKVLSVFNARELAKTPAALSGKIIVNSVNPGLCVSGLRDGVGPVAAWIMNAMSWSGEKGTRNFLYATTQNTTQGAYVDLCKEAPPSIFVVSAKGRETQEKYWNECGGLFKALGVDPQLNQVLRA